MDEALTALGGVLVVVVSIAGAWIVSRRRDETTADLAEAQTVDIYRRSERQAWDVVKELRTQLDVLEEFKDAATPVLLKCAAEHPELYQQMLRLKLLNGRTADKAK